jgi:hypothetical protein
MAGIIVPIGADASGFNQVVNGLPEKVAKASKGMNAAGATGGMSKMLGGIGQYLGAGLVAREIYQMVGAMDDLADTAIRLGESTDSIQRVAFAANILAGMDIDSVAASFLKLEKAITDPDNKKAAEALEHFGITASELAGMTLDQKVLALGEAFTKARQTGTGYNDILALLGKSAGELIPLLQQSAEAAELMADASIVDAGKVAMLAKYNDEIGKLIINAKNFGTTVIGETMGAAENLGTFVGSIAEYWKELFSSGDFEKATDHMLEVLALSQEAKDLEARAPEVEASKAAKDREERSKAIAENARAAKTDGIKKQSKENAEKAAEIKRGLAIRRNEFEEKRKSDIASRLNDLASKGESRMQDFIGAAFSPLKGDADISTGRGGNVNPLTRGASEQVKKMAEQVSLLRKQAATLDKSAAHLANIDAQIKKMNIKTTYN